MGHKRQLARAERHRSGDLSNPADVEFKERREAAELKRAKRTIWRIYHRDVQSDGLRITFVDDESSGDPKPNIRHAFGLQYPQSRMLRMTRVTGRKFKKFGYTYKRRLHRTVTVQS